MLQRIIDFVKGLLGSASSSATPAKTGAQSGLRSRDTAASGRSKTRK